MTRLLLADRVKGRAESCLSPLISVLDQHYETRFTLAGPGDDLAEAIRGADIVWLEWCLDHADWPRGRPCRTENPSVVRLHSIKGLQTSYPAGVDWSRVTRLITVSDDVAEVLLDRFASIGAACR